MRSFFGCGPPYMCAKAWTFPSILISFANFWIVEFTWQILSMMFALSWWVPVKFTQHVAWWKVLSQPGTSSTQRRGGTASAAERPVAMTKKCDNPTAPLDATGCHRSVLLLNIFPCKAVSDARFGAKWKYMFVSNFEISIVFVLTNLDAPHDVPRIYYFTYRM